MTAFYQPLKRESDGRWDMTRGTGSTKPYAIGYCRGWTEDLPGEGAVSTHLREEFEKDRERRRPFQEKYHRDGHAASGEATACWLLYQIDQRLKFLEDPETQKKCFVCAAWTTWLAVFRGSSFMVPLPVCQAHQDRDLVHGHLRSE